MFNSKIISLMPIYTNFCIFKCLGCLPKVQTHTLYNSKFSVISLEDKLK
jgi:hypothetical protein